MARPKINTKTETLNLTVDASIKRELKRLAAEERTSVFQTGYEGSIPFTRSNPKPQRIQTFRGNPQEISTCRNWRDSRLMTTVDDNGRIKFGQFGQVKIRWCNRRKRWRVSYKTRGRYARRDFETERAAKDFTGEHAFNLTELGSAWVDLSGKERAELIEAHRMAKAAGISVGDAVRRAADAAPGAITLGDLLADMLSAKRARGLRERSLNALRQTIAAFIAGREKLPASSVTPVMVREWIDSRGWSAVRRGVAQTELSTMFRHGIRSGALVRNPCDQIERPIVEAKATTVLTPEQTERLFRITESQDPDLLGFLALAAFGGFRTESEVQRMTRVDVVAALASGVIRPPVENKTRRQRIVPVLPNLRAWLEVWVRRKVDIIPPNFRKRWPAVRKAAGLHPWPQNVLRHSRASYRLADTGDERMTAAEDGHSPDVLVRHYRALVTAEDARRYFSIFPTANQQRKQT